MTFEIGIDAGRVEQALTEATNTFGHAVPLMETVANTLTSVTALNFLAQGRPRWLVLKYPSAKRQGGMILQDSGHLRDSIEPGHTDATATIGTNVIYAAIHQLGGETRPHTIVPKNKQALAFDGRVVKKANHSGSKIPARPFLPIDERGDLQPEAASAIISATQEYLHQAIED